MATFRQSANRSLRAGFTVGLASALMACGGGDGSPAAAPAPATTAATTIVRVDVSPPSLLLKPGGNARLSARVVDSTGAVVAGATVTWRAASAVVAIDADGTVTAGNAVDSTVVVASYGAVRSAPVTALVAQPADAAQLVDDSQIVGEPALFDTGAAPGIGARMRVTLSGVGTPAAGALIVGSGGKRLGGKVVSSTANGGNTDVVLETVPLTELFKQMKFEQTYQPRELTDKFDVTPAKTTERLDGGREYEFSLDTPDTAAPLEPSTAAKRPGTVRGQASVTLGSRKWKVGPFLCNASTVAQPVIGFRNMAPHVIDNMGPVTATVLVQDGTFLVDVQSQGSMKLVVDGEIRVGGGLKGVIACDARLFKREIPVPPLVALVFVPTVPVVGLRANVSAELQAGDVAIGIQSSIDQPMRLGLRIDPDGSVTNLSSIDSAETRTTFAWQLKSISQGADVARFLGDASAGLYAQASFTNVPLQLAAVVDPDIDPYKSLLDAFAGFHSTLSLASTNAQLQDAGLQTGYNVNALVQLRLGDDLASAYGWLSRLVKIGSLVLPSVKYEPTLFSQPDGTARTTLRRFVAGDDVYFVVALDPATVEPTFLGQPTVGYNVKQVEIWRKRDGDSSERVGIATGAPGQSDFTVHWKADAAASTSDSTSAKAAASFYAVVVPNFGSDFGFRVGPVLGWLGVIQIGGGHDQEGSNVVVDQQGNVIIASYSVDPLVQENRSRVGGYDEIQILKLDPYGQLLWARNIDGPGDENAVGMAVDRDGSIYVSGIAFASPLTDATTGSGPILTSWLARFDANGDRRWLRQWQEAGSSFTTGEWLALGPNRELYVFGVVASAAPAYVGGSVFNIQCSKPNSASDEPQYDCGDAALRRFDPDSGTLLWSMVDKRAGQQIARGITVDAAGNVYTAVQTAVDTETQDTATDASHTDFGDRYLETAAGNVTTSHVGAAFAMWSSTGSVVWRSNVKNVRQPAAGGGFTYTDERPSGIVMAGDGSLWSVIRTTGAFPGTASAGRTDSALFRLDVVTGAPERVALYGSAGDDRLTLAGPTPSGDMLLFGTTTGSLFGASAGGSDVVVARLAPDGSTRWAQQLGGAGNDAGVGAGAAGNGNVFVTGSTDGLLPATLSGLPAGTALNTAAGGKDLFIAKLAAGSGTIQASPQRSLSATPAPFARTGQ